MLNRIFPESARHKPPGRGFFRVSKRIADWMNPQICTLCGHIQSVGHAANAAGTDKQTRCECCGHRL
jgi:hypothetical protein